MIKIEVTGNSIAEVADKLLALGTSLGASNIAKYDAQAAAQQVVEPKKPEEGKEPANTPVEPVAEPKSAPDAPSEKPLDFDKDVAPVVLNAVKVHSKEWVQEVLSEFGVARASQVPDEQLAELLAALQAGPQ